MLPSSNNYKHFQAAHCESGVTSNLLKGVGLEVSEAMCFGLGSGLLFLHLPFIKVMELPLTSYRSFPGSIFKKACKRLGLAYDYRNFPNPIIGTRALDQLLIDRQPVGIRANIFWLPYIPEKFRFQFNAHNLVVVGKDPDGNYLISDPILESTSTCPNSAMTRARFSKGPLAPKGLIFFPKSPEQDISAQRWEKAIRAAVRETVQRMLYSPLPFVGVRGIDYLARKMMAWPIKLKSEEEVKLNLANVIRMQEEIGTGGAGFRYLYAAFLQESAERLDNPHLRSASRDMTEVGNVWRDFATLAAKYCKGRADFPYEQMAKQLHLIGDQEKLIYRKLWSQFL